MDASGSSKRQRTTTTQAEEDGHAVAGAVRLRPTVVCSSPRLEYYDEFLSEHEVEHLLAMAEPRLAAQHHELPYYTAAFLPPLSRYVKRAEAVVTLPARAHSVPPQASSSSPTSSTKELGRPAVLRMQVVRASTSGFPTATAAYLTPHGPADAGVLLSCATAHLGTLKPSSPRCDVSHTAPWQAASGDARRQILAQCCHLDSSGSAGVGGTSAGISTRWWRPSSSASRR